VSSELGLGGCGEDDAIRHLLGGSVEREEGARKWDVVSRRGARVLCGRHCARVKLVE
jgi:hypothetical protein